MVLPGETSMSRSFRWLLAAGLAALGAAPGAYAQTASCNITYTAPTWVGGNGFGASIDIRNTGAAITNGWTLVFAFPNGQLIQNGWPVSFSQSGATVTVASNADWNKAIPSGGLFNVAFNGTFSGANNPPTAFTLNGTACSIGGGTNPAPTVSLTSPTANQNFASGAAVPLAATASDSNGTIASVVFRIDGNVVNTDTTSPYSFSATGVANGTHTATATATDNGGASTTSTTVTFTVGGGSNPPPTVSLTSPTANQNFASGAAVPLAATASDSNGTIASVVFRIDGN